jgi:uncharacterized repeat protein (TIGR03803 family)
MTKAIVSTNKGEGPIIFQWNRIFSVLLLCLAAMVSSQAQVLTTLHSFNEADGWRPVRMFQSTDGNFYGVTAAGGAGGSNFGTVFKMTNAGALTTLHSFNQADGWSPAALIKGTDGNFYGTTASGGPGGSNYGTIFKMTPTGVLTTLHAFNQADGWQPGGMFQNTDGNFYGVTASGGPGGSNYGTIFKMTPAGALTTLHSFNQADGWSPAALIKGTDGNFYGTTASGGPGGSNYGTIFKMTPTGVLTTLHAFNQADGWQPGGMFQNTDGNFYGVTASGGPGGSSYGTIFKMTPTGALTTLHAFDQTDGWNPAALFKGTDGNFYGTTVGGGAGGGNFGTIFEMTPADVLTTLHIFDQADGSQPGGMFQSTDGNFYGVTAAGGAGGYGTAFKLP